MVKVRCSPCPLRAAGLDLSPRVIDWEHSEPVSCQGPQAQKEELQRENLVCKAGQDRASNPAGAVEEQSPS